MQAFREAVGIVREGIRLAADVLTDVDAARTEPRQQRFKGGNLLLRLVPSIVDPIKSRVSLRLFRTQPPTLCMAVPLSIRSGTPIMA